MTVKLFLKNGDTSIVIRGYFSDTDKPLFNSKLKTEITMRLLSVFDFTIFMTKRGYPQFFLINLGLCW